MYHPYFRGKQYELITIRETAPLLAAANFVPLIEPVKEGLEGLHRAIKAVCDVGGRSVITVNPNYGDHSRKGESISSLLKEKYLDVPGVSAGILLKRSMTANEALECCNLHSQHPITLIHAGFSDGRQLAQLLGERSHNYQHVFFPECGRLYWKNFPSGSRVIMGDGFERRRNRDHPAEERFSDLHVTFPDDGMNGFGDFLTVGNEFSEGGGPAYAVAIHLTFIDPERDNEMYIYHFVSDSKDTPTNPGGNFAEALTKMIKKIDDPKSKILETSAIQEFRDLHSKGHFPGLGYIKKLSMKHHIETLATFFGS